MKEVFKKFSRTENDIKGG